ncbi:MAG: hypothetical protein IAE87_18985 [Rhodobacteraceae bacterium]|nr:hypothetical protein [Paracoccaceae bacterium]
MIRAAALLVALLLAPGLARADEAVAPEGGQDDGSGPAVATGRVIVVDAPAVAETAPGEANVLAFDLMLDGTGYGASLTPGDLGIALRIWRADHNSMADEGYLVADLGEATCRQAGRDFDTGAAMMLDRGTWLIEGGCK